LAYNTELLQIDLSGNNFEGTTSTALDDHAQVKILMHSNRLDGKILKFLPE
jgi:hypothetical protein